MAGWEATTAAVPTRYMGIMPIPNDWGSGSSAGQGNAGGGLVRVTAGSLQLEGVLLANGSGSSSGSGSGGGVYVAVNTLSGDGSIQAKGGSSTYGYGGGGGGRVAVYAGDWSGFNVGGITAPWGNGDCGGSRHGASKAQRRCCWHVGD